MQFASQDWDTHTYARLHKTHTFIKPPACTQPLLTQWVQVKGSRWSENMAVVKINAFLLVETISRNCIQSRGSLSSCDQKLFSPKNVPTPFFAVEVKRPRRKGQGYYLDRRTLQPPDLTIHHWNQTLPRPSLSLCCMKQEEHSQIPQLRLLIIKL